MIIKKQDNDNRKKKKTTIKISGGNLVSQLS